MKCSTCQYQLLMSGDPGLPAQEVAAHLTDCSSCREWQQRLLRIEGSVARLPVPPSRAKEPLVRQLLQLDSILPLPPAPVPQARPLWRRMAVGAAAVAAAVLLAVCGVLIGNFLSRSVGPTAPGPLVQAPAQTDRSKEKILAPAGSTLVARLLACDLKLAEAASTRQRVEVLAALADELQEETQGLCSVAAGKDLKSLARLYEKVVRDGVVPRARSLPAGERRPVLGPIAERLSRTRRQVLELARAERPEAAESLRRIGAAAGEADSRLRALMGEETP